MTFPHRRPAPERRRSALSPRTANDDDPSAESTSTSRQLFLESDEYTLDLRVAGFATPEIGSVAGSCAHEGGRPVANAPAYLLCDGRLAAAGSTTETGEFEFEGRLDSPLELWLFDEADRPITVTLHQSEQSRSR